MADNLILFDIQVKGSEQIVKDYAVAERATKNLSDELRSLRGQIKAVEKAQKSSDGSADLIDREKRLKRLKTEYQKVTGELAQMREAQKRLGQELRNRSKDLEAQEGSVFALRKELFNLTRQYDMMGKAARESTSGKQVIKNLKKTRKELSKLEEATGRYQRNVGNYRSVFTNFGDDIVMAAGAPASLVTSLGAVGGAAGVAGLAVAALGAGAIKSANDFGVLDDQIAEVRKTTDLGREAAYEMYDQLLQIDTRTSVENLLLISKAAGRLGVRGKENIADFTEAVDRLQLALGDDLQGTADQTATTIGKITSTFGIDERFGLAEGLERVGSVINELSKNEKAQAPFIIDVTKRLQGLGKTVGFTLPFISAVGSTMDILGLRTEAATTAFQKFTIRIARQPEMFKEIAKQVGITAEEFDRLASEDPDKLLLEILRAGNNSEEGLNALNETLEKFGITSVRELEAIGALVKETDLLTEQYNLASRALQENTSVQNEAEIANSTYNAAIEKLTKQLTALWREIGGQVAPYIEIFAGKLEDSVKWLNANSDAIFKVISRLNTLSSSFRDVISGRMFVGGFSMPGANLTDNLRRRFIEMYIGSPIDWDKKARENAKAAEDAAKNYFKGRMSENKDAFGFDIFSFSAPNQENPFKSGFKSNVTTEEEEAIGRYKALTKEAGRLKNTVQDLAAANLDYSYELQRYLELIEEINEIDKIFDKNDVETAKAMQGSIASLNILLADYQAQLSNINMEQNPERWKMLMDAIIKTEQQINNLKQAEEEYRQSLLNTAFSLSLYINNLDAVSISAESAKQKFFELVLGIKLSAEAAKELFDELPSAEELDISKLNTERYNYLEQLAEKYRAGQLESEEEYLKQRDKLNEKYDLKIMRRKLAAMQEGTEEYAKLAAEIAHKEAMIREESGNKELEWTREHQELLRDTALEYLDTFAESAVRIRQNQADAEFRASMRGLEREYDRKLELAEGDQELQRELRREREEEELRLREEKFEKDKEIAIDEALINAAVGITRAYATLDWISATIVSAGIATMAALQVAEIKSRTFREGGFTSQKDSMGFGDQHGDFVGYVHPDEYVAPKEQLSDYPELFNFLEQDRRQRFRGFRFGGYSTAPPPIVANPQSVIRGSNAGLSRQEMNDLLDGMAVRIAEATMIGSKEGTEKGTYKQRQRDALIKRMERNRVV